MKEGGRSWPDNDEGNVHWNITQGYNDVWMRGFCGHWSSKSCDIKASRLWEQA